MARPQLAHARLDGERANGDDRRDVGAPALAQHEALAADRQRRKHADIEARELDVAVEPVLEQLDRRRPQAPLDEVVGDRTDDEQPGDENHGGNSADPPPPALSFPRNDVPRLSVLMCFHEPFRLCCKHCARDELADGSGNTIRRVDAGARRTAPGGPAVFRGLARLARVVVGVCRTAGHARRARRVRRRRQARGVCVVLRPAALPDRQRDRAAIARRARAAGDILSIWDAAPAAPARPGPRRSRRRRVSPPSTCTRGRSAKPRRRTTRSRSMPTSSEAISRA